MSSCFPLISAIFQFLDFLFSPCRLVCSSSPFHRHSPLSYSFNFCSISLPLPPRSPSPSSASLPPTLVPSLHLFILPSSCSPFVSSAPSSKSSPSSSSPFLRLHSSPTLSCLLQEGRLAVPVAAVCASQTHSFVNFNHHSITRRCFHRSPPGGAAVSIARDTRSPPLPKSSKKLTRYERRANIIFWRARGSASIDIYRNSRPLHET